MNEDAIREAFCGRIGALYRDWNMNEHDQFLDFKAGYLVMLNSLEAANLRIIEQAAVIEKLRSGMLECRKLNSLDNVGWSIDVSDAIDELLAIPTDSKQILADWMREQLGEPFVYQYLYKFNANSDSQGLPYDPCFVEKFSTTFPVVGKDITPLFKLPDILK